MYVDGAKPFKILRAHCAIQEDDNGMRSFRRKQTKKNTLVILIPRLSFSSKGRIDVSPARSKIYQRTVCLANR
jgi:hypothetical protein